MSASSFRSVLGSLRAAQLDRYLSTNGWITLEANGNSRSYSRPIDGEPGDYAITWRLDASQNQRIDQLYKLVFKLSCIEDREPIDVALAIQAQSVPAPLAEPPRDCIKTVLVDALNAFPQILPSEATAEYIRDMTPIIARVEFMTNAMGTATLTSQAKATQAALILAPAVQRLPQATNAALLNAFVRHVAGRLVVGSSNDGDDVLAIEQAQVHKLIETLHNDPEEMPQQSVRVLQDLFNI